MLFFDLSLQASRSILAHILSNDLWEECHSGKNVIKENQEV
jgi:hypothetical protein